MGELAPRVYSSGKTQEDAISEILEAFESSDIVFFKGVVGSGKSVVGIRTALEFGRGVVSMPTKVLSDQYAQAYEREKFFVKCNGSRASLCVIKGRRNFPCLYLQERGWEGSAASRSIPCRRPLRKREGERRLDALRECRHWGFLFPMSYDREIWGTEKLPYTGISGEWMVCLRGGCPYWRQFVAYANSDVVIVNFAKWMAEIQIGRIPRVPITVVDEADEWLDSLALKAVISEKHIARLLDAVKGKPGLEEVHIELGESWKSALNGRLDPLDFAELFVSILEELDETSDDIFWKLRAVLEHREGVE
jgi:Rad3-related DNA helicase